MIQMPRVILISYELAKMVAKILTKRIDGPSYRNGAMLCGQKDWKTIKKYDTVPVRGF